MTQQNAPAVKLCINCKHYQAATKHEEVAVQAEYARCAILKDSKTVQLNRVDGREIIGQYCEVARMPGAGCGVDATLFEAA